jgi:predicted phage terminase large subunit-like protein
VNNLAKNLSDVELLELYMLERARDDFWEYRKLIRPDMITGWFQYDLACKLQEFHDKMIQGVRPIMVVQAPPQHGKSVTVMDFIAWIAGKCPNLKTGFASYSDMLGVRANLHLQRTFSENTYKKVFPCFRLPKKSSPTTVNRSKIDFANYRGSFRNTTAGGSITGECLDIGIIDDALKGREQANSQTIRDKVWDWFTDDFSTRLSSNGALLIVMTRWHTDDLIGRLIAQSPDNLTVVKYQAIAEVDEMYRRADEPLFTELKPLDFLLELKSRQAGFSWQSLYQQNPIEQGGNIIKSSYFRFYQQLPSLSYRVIYADTAQKTKEHNDYSVFQCWGKMDSGDICLVDQVRGRWDSVDLETQAVAFWSKHSRQVGEYPPEGWGRLRTMKVEDKVSGTGLIQKLRRESQIPIMPIQRCVDKYTRLCDNLGYIESGRVWLPQNALWLSDFLTECEHFSADMGHSFDDQIDPMLDAVEDLLAKQKVSFYE